MPHKVFLIPEVLEIILLATDTHTLLLSQRVCRRWRKLIQGSHHLRAALFLDPVRYRLPRGERGIRNPLLKKYLWPWLRENRARTLWQPPTEGEQIVPQINPAVDKRFLDNKNASWRNMLFQQPPRSCVGVVEMDSRIQIGTPAYTEFQAQKVLRVKDVLIHYHKYKSELYQPLADEGIFWYGTVPRNSWGDQPSSAKRYFQRNGPLQSGILSYAREVYLRDCDIVLFTRDARGARGDYNHSVGDAVDMNRWFMDTLGASMVPGQTFIPVPVS